jgi:hypothetical protein
MYGLDFLIVMIGSAWVGYMVGLSVMKKRALTLLEKMKEEYHNGV